MACFNPIPAVDFGYKVNKEGKTVRNIKLIDIRGRYLGWSLDQLKERYGNMFISLPCGHCVGCANDYSKMWASRICLEASFHNFNSFITLTYADGCCPKKLTKRPFQLFIKRLRKELGFPIRYFACGELGEGKGVRSGFNPHYHAVIFGYDFPDKVLFKRSGSGLIIYRSPLLEKLWPFGISSIGEVTPDSAQYVAKYSMKRKISGVDNGEFVLMSRRPGIGVQGYSDNIYFTDKLYLHGRRYKIPRYFDKIAEAANSFAYLTAKFNRERLAKNRPDDKFSYDIYSTEEMNKYLEEDMIYKTALKVRSI